jgi:cytochrome c biogenesis protein ResB
MTLLLAALPLMAARDGIAGHWTLEGDVAGNPVNLTCTMVQADAPKFTGECKLNDSDTVSLTGETKGQKVTFSFDTGGYTLNYTGTMGADTMQGDIEVQGTTGTFTGKRTDSGATKK